MNLNKRLLGILFVSGDVGVTRQELAQSLDVTLLEIDTALEEIKSILITSELSPIELVQYDKQFSLVTKKELIKDVEKFAQAPFNQTLSRAAIETLAIIAYSQPITRMAIEEIRGVQSSNLIQRLLNKNLVKEVGRIEAPGRPALYSVTSYFMDYFGMTSLDELPEVDPIALKTQIASDQLYDLFKWDNDDTSDNYTQEEI